jgi:hypothetical protein
MTDERAQGLRRALQRNRASAVRTGWVRKFQALTGVDEVANALLSAEMTAALKQQFVRRLKSADGAYREWPVRAREDVIAHLRSLGRLVGPVEVILFSNVDELIGGARVTADLVLGDPFTIWDFVGNDLSMVTEDLSSGLCVEMNDYTRSGEYEKDGVFSVLAWGVFAIDQPA